MKEKLNQIQVMQGDITRLAIDAIVNAANSSLLGGGGVDGAIHRAGGAAILAECRKIVAEKGGCPAGEAVITSGGMLPARFVIHTVGPVWRGGNSGESELLSACYRNSLSIALEKNFASIAFPNISTGIYGYPKDKAAVVAINTVKEFLRHTDAPIHVTFICFDNENYQIYRSMLSELHLNG